MSSQTIFITKDTANVTADIALQSSVDGSVLTGLAFNTAGIKCYYKRGSAGILTALALVTQTAGGVHADGGFVEIDAVNAPGLYRLDLSDAIFAAGENSGTIIISGAANLQPHVINVVLQDAVTVPPTASAIATEVKNTVVESQGSITIQQALSTILSFSAGVTTTGGTVIKTPDGVATRITATVNGSNERTAITLTPSA